MAWLNWLIHHPKVALALKAGVASGLAFFVGAQLPAPLDEYKYYAVLGAFTVIGLIVVDSIKESLRVLGAVSIGVGVAVVIQVLAWTNPLSVALAVFGCVLLGALPVLGQQRDWAPLAALFVLATGGPDPEPIALGYLVQVPLGAALGILVNLVLLAPLGSRDLVNSVEAMRDLVANQMRIYAHILEEELDGSVDGDAAQRRSDTVTVSIRELEHAHVRLLTLISDGQRAQRGNPRARRRAGREASAHARAEAISRCAVALAAAAVILSQADPAVEEQGRRTRRVGVELLRRSSEVFDRSERFGDDPAMLARTRETLDRMMHQVRAADPNGGPDHLLFGALALSVGRCLDVFEQELVGSE